MAMPNFSNETPGNASDHPGRTPPAWPPTRRPPNSTTLVRRRLPKISLGTVYRNLDLLARMGMIQRLEMAGAETRFDGDARPHDHVRCTGCGRIDDLAGPARGAVAGRPAMISPATRSLGHRLEFVGLCPECRP